VVASLPELEVLHSGQRTGKVLGEPALVGGGLTDTETCRSCKFPLVSVHFKFGVLVHFRHGRCPPGGGNIPGVRDPCVFGVCNRLVCFIMFNPFCVFFCVMCGRQEFVIV
jgi:hypothetical protein